MQKQKNDDTKTKLGDIFHYLIVLEHCLELKSGEIIYVEKFGDLSIQSNEISKNMEIKHHQKRHNLSNRHDDFWNTLRNWVKYYKNMLNFKKLLLVTTSTLKDNSLFEEWEYTNASERMKLLKNEGEKILKRETGFRFLYDEIFSFEEDIVLSILEKIEIQTGEEKVFKRKEKIKQHPIFSLIDDKNADSFIYELLGYILMKPVEHDGDKWEISYDDYKKHATEVRDMYAKQARPLPNTFSNKEPENINSYMDKNFVKKILDIKYEEEVVEAIINFWRMNQTCINFFNDDPIYLKDLINYREDIKKRLNRMRKSFIKQCDEGNVFNVSQDFFNEVMLLQALAFGSINPNRDFFQQGIVHSIADEGDLTWNLKN